MSETPVANYTPKPAPAPAQAPQPQWVPPAKQPSAFKRGFGVGFGFTIGMGLVAAVLSIISLISLIASAGAFAAAMRSSASTASSTTQTIWGSATATKTMRAIDIAGTIYAAGGSGSLLSAGTYGYEIADQIDAMSADEASGLVLLMNTPGGTINGAKAIADAVARYQERTGHKVIAYVEGMSASGGMYAMAGVDEIIADYGTLVGSIGVVMGPFARYKDVTATSGTFIENGYTTSGGVTMEYFTAGTGKDFGNAFRDMTEAERSNYQHGIDVEYEAFVNHVAAGRKMPADRIKNELGAFMFDPKTAIEKGLVDQVMGRDAAFRRAAELNNLDPADTKIIKPAMPGLLGSLLGAEARIYGHTAPTKAGAEVAANPLCTTAVTVLAYSGDMATLCK